MTLSERTDVIVIDEYGVHDDHAFRAGVATRAQRLRVAQRRARARVTEPHDDEGATRRMQEWCLRRAF